MNLPAMGDSTPRVKKAVENAERTCPTDSHRYGYMISVAQGLEIELDKREKQLLDVQYQLITRNAEYASAMEYGHKWRLEAALKRQSDIPGE